ncbi:hypothetical protein ABIB29_001086 [Arthrobacter sp. UYEF36]
MRGTDPLRDLADACLGGLGELARRDARSAALKVRFTADYAEATRALASPGASPHDRAVQEMALVAEVACALTVSENAAGALLGESQALTTVLPLTLAALQTGTISWAHARIMVEETSNLDPAGAAALEAHFLDPDAPNPARGCPAGDLVPGRFRAKARAWRERHHPVSIEERHTRCAADRRVEYCPDRDGMAWLSAYLPADTAAGIWERTTAAARALQGPDETRTLTQLRADVAATLLLGTDGTAGGTDADADADDNGGCGGVPVPRAQVLVTVPVLSLIGAGEEPATLDGYGPIPPSMARRLVADGAGSFYRVLTDPGRGPAGNREDQLPAHEGYAPLAPAPRRPVPLPRLQQPLVGQRGRPPAGLGRRRHHRDLQPRTAVPQAPPPQTRLRLDTIRGQQTQTAGLDLTLRTALSQRTAGLGTTTMATRQSGIGYGLGPRRARGSRPGPALDLPVDPGPDPGLDLPVDPGPDPGLDLPVDAFPDWYLFPAGHQIPAAETDWREPDEGSCLETFLIHSA